MAEKTKQPEKAKQVASPVRAEKPKQQPAKPGLLQRAKQAADQGGRSGDKGNQPNAIAKWWRETVGELRKVSWPTTQESWRLTWIVLLVMVLTSLLLGFLDFLFSTVISRLVA